MPRPSATLALILLAPALPADEKVPRLLDRVEVSRVVIDARIVDGSGKPVLGLKPENFRVEVDGEPIRLDSVDWIGKGRTEESRAPVTPTVFLPDDAEDAPPPGRLTVILFQRALERSRFT